MTNYLINRPSIPGDLPTEDIPKIYFARQFFRAVAENILGYRLVHAHAVTRLEENIAKLGGRADRLGVPAPVLHLLGSREGGRYFAEVVRHGMVQRVPFRGVYARVEHNRVRLGGFSFVGVVEPLGDGLGVACVPGETIPTEFRDPSNFVCDHCGTERRRNKIIIVRDEEGNFVRVGASCSKDYLGGHDAFSVARLYFAALEEVDASGETILSSAVHDAPDTAEFLAWVAQSIRVNGWVSRTTARDSYTDSVTATVDLARAHRIAYYFRPWEGVEAPSDEDHALAKSTIEKVNAILGDKENRNDYEHNLLLAVNAGEVSPRFEGILASAITFVQRAESKAVEEAIERANRVDAHLGTPGARDDYELRLTRVIETEGYYGTTYIHQFAGPRGELAVWFASVNWARRNEIGAGTTVRVAATVKGHSDYHGRPQTVFTRVSAPKV